jgi:hypothetical protein
MHFLSNKNIIIFIATLFFLPNISFAQSVSFSVSPRTPEVGQTVSITASSVDANVNQSEISWYKDGRLDKKGIGMRNYSFVMGNQSVLIRAVARSTTGQFEGSVAISPAGVDLLWEAVGSYDPPFYKGKIMPIKNSFIKVVAIPEVSSASGSNPDSATFSYAWEKDGSNFVGQSGYGRNGFTYTPSVLERENTIGVNVSGHGINKTAQINIPLRTPEIHFYEYNQFYGPLYNRAIRDNQRFVGPIVSIVAEPYGVFTSDLDSNSLITEWRLNGNNIQSEQKNAVFLNFGGNTGNIDLSFRADNANQLLQGVQKALRINIVSQ